MAIRVSSLAAREMLKRSKELFFYCKSGGCNGFEYVLEPCSEKPPKTETQTLEIGVLLHTCEQSLFHLLGTEVDWQEDVMGSRFIFHNPRENNCINSRA